MTTQVHDSMTITGPDVQSPLIASPLTGTTVSYTPTQPQSRIILTPAGSLAALTVAVANGIIDGQSLSVFSKTSISTLTLTGTFLANALAVPATISAGQQYTFIWSVSLAGWVRVV